MLWMTGKGPVGESLPGWLVDDGHDAAWCRQPQWSEAGAYAHVDSQGSDGTGCAHIQTGTVVHPPLHELLGDLDEASPAVPKHSRSANVSIADRQVACRGADLGIGQPC